jgi:hypothetical protein
MLSAERCENIKRSHVLDVETVLERCSSLPSMTKLVERKGPDENTPTSYHCQYYEPAFEALRYRSIQFR